MKIIIRDRNEDFISNVRALLDHQPTEITEIVSTQCASIFVDNNWDNVVSPANSFGFMNGGIDQVYIDQYGQQLEDRVREMIYDYYKGELLVGQAFWLPIVEGSDQNLIVAPTMRVPQRIVDPVDVYLATRAAVRCAYRNDKDETLIIPGMGTGTGRVNYHTAARNMLIGIKDALDTEWNGVKIYKTCAEAYLDNQKFVI